MRILHIFFAKIVEVIPIPHAQLEVELDFAHFLIAVSRTKLVKKIEGVNIEADIRRNFLLLDSEPTRSHFAIADRFLQALEDSCEVLDIGSLLCRLEEVLELLENGLRRHQDLVSYGFAFLPPDPRILQSF